MPEDYSYRWTTLNVTQLSESDNEEDLGMTHFRAARDCEKRGSKKKNKFHFDTSLESDSD